MGARTALERGRETGEKPSEACSNAFGLLMQTEASGLDEISKSTPASHQRVSPPVASLEYDSYIGYTRSP